jgi:hypothetical protein
VCAYSRCRATRVCQLPYLNFSLTRTALTTYGLSQEIIAKALALTVAKNSAHTENLRLHNQGLGDTIETEAAVEPTTPSKEATKHLQPVMLTAFTSNGLVNCLGTTGITFLLADEGRSFFAGLGATGSEDADTGRLAEVRYLTVTYDTCGLAFKAILKPNPFLTQEYYTNLAFIFTLSVVLHSTARCRWDFPLSNWCTSASDFGSVQCPCVGLHAAGRVYQASAQEFRGRFSRFRSLQPLHGELRTSGTFPLCPPEFEPASRPHNLDSVSRVVCSLVLSPLTLACGNRAHD